MLHSEALDALYEYQVEGVDWLGKHGSFGLFDERGLGKSLQYLVDFHNLRQHRPTARTLMVASNNVIYKWANDEIQKWSSYSSEVASGTAKQRRAALTSGADFVLIAYDNLLRELDTINEQGFYQVGFDESHNIKGLPWNGKQGKESKGTKRTWAAHRIRCARRGLITGSPMLVNVGDLWPQLFLIAPTVFPNQWSFLNRYAVYGGYEGREIVGIQNAAELRTRMAPFVLRRLIKDVGQHIPSLTTITVRYDLSPYQRKVYEQAQSDLKIELDGKVLSEFVNPAHAATKLRQIIGTPLAVGLDDDSATLDMALTELDKISKDYKVVIYTGSVPVARAMRQRLTDRGEAPGWVSGETPEGRPMTAQARFKVVEDFQTKRSPRVMVATYGVIKEGIDLYAANYAIVLDKLWVPELQDQAIGRLQRTGQIHPVIQIELMPNNTINSRVEKVLSMRRATFGTMFNQNNFESMLREKLLELLEDE